MTRVNADAATGKIERVPAGMAQRISGNFKKCEMHFVRTVDELLTQRVEIAVEGAVRGDTPLGRVRLGALPLVGMKVQFFLEAAARQLAEVAAAFQQQLPELFQVVGAGKATGQPDDRQRFFRKMFHRGSSRSAGTGTRSLSVLTVPQIAVPQRPTGRFHQELDPSLSAPHARPWPCAARLSGSS